MTRRDGSRIGRPSKGDRRTFYMRAPVADADAVDQRAEASGAYLSDLLAALVRIGLDHADELPEQFQPKEVLPESA